MAGKTFLVSFDSPHNGFRDFIVGLIEAENLESAHERLSSVLISNGQDIPADPDREMVGRICLEPWIGESIFSLVEVPLLERTIPQILKDLDNI